MIRLKSRLSRNESIFFHFKAFPPWPARKPGRTTLQGH
jgi:hypothetical protein